MKMYGLIVKGDPNRELLTVEIENGFEGESFTCGPQHQLRLNSNLPVWLVPDKTLAERIVKTATKNDYLGSDNTYYNPYIGFDDLWDNDLEELKKLEVVEVTINY